MTDFEEIYQTYFHDVFAYIRSLSGDEHIAEEITSEAFLKAMGKIDQFRGECQIRVWLCQIARNCYYSYLKKAGKLMPLPAAELSELPDSGEDIEEQIIRSDEAQRIKKMLHGIQEPYKEVFLWRVFAELSFKEIGDIFHKSDHWACVTYHRARNMIRERLEEQEHEK